MSTRLRVCATSATRQERTKFCTVLVVLHLCINGIPSCASTRFPCAMLWMLRCSKRKCSSSGCRSPVVLLVVVQALVCIECGEDATRSCKECDDFFCEPCFSRLHRKGRKSKHEWAGFPVRAPVCAECQNKVATQRCTVSSDALCEECAVSTRQKGNKSEWKLEKLLDPLQVRSSHIESIYRDRNRLNSLFACVAGRTRALHSLQPASRR